MAPSCKLSEGELRGTLSLLPVRFWLGDGEISLPARPQLHLCIPGCHDVGSVLITRRFGGAPCSNVCFRPILIVLTRLVARLQLKLRKFPPQAHVLGLYLV